MSRFRCLIPSFPLSILLLLLALSQSLQSLAAILAIDYGSEWIKSSLFKPGVPFDVLLNRDSKRKIQSTVAWKNSDRLFSTDASNIVREPFISIFNHVAQ